MPSLKWEEAARADLKGIADYISDDDSDAALKLIDEIEAKALMLLDHPRLYRKGRLPGTREMVVRRNYIVVYAETREIVTVLRVLHAAMKWP